MMKCLQFMMIWNMSSGWARLVKSTWVKLLLAAVFVLANLILYLQSKDLILKTALRLIATNRSSLFAPAIATSSNSDGNFVLLQNMANGSSAAVGSAEHSRLMHTDFVAMTNERSFLREQVVNPHDFKYVVTPNVTCFKGDVVLLICVPISNNNYAGRAVIRQTWGSYAYNTSNKARLVFFIGITPPETEKSASFTQTDIIEESALYGDILQEDFVDTYANLSLKSVSILKWVSLSCSSARFILKADDDMYVNIPLLIDTLHTPSSDKSRPDAYIIGSLQANAQPNRNPSSKWYTPVSMFSGSAYPNYLSGTAYAMTSVAASLLYHASLRVPSFWLEDIYITGFCAKKASIQVYDSGYFTYGKPAVSGCTFKNQISGHRYTHQEILQIHKELYDPNLRC